MHKSKLRRITLAVCFALMPFTAGAAGLGKLTVISGLGEPLNGEIELLSTTPEELSTLTADIAPEEAYAVQGLERSALHNSIEIEVSKKPDGTPILKLSTHQPISDPFLDMLVQVDWATGRLLREYRKRYPLVAIHLEERTPERVWEMVAKGRLSAAITRPVLTHQALGLLPLLGE